jgi:metal-sulfur cluster biosynthetic enzyme
VELKRRVWDALREVRDDQLMQSNGNVVDLGYIYDVGVWGDVVHILMTMPHRGRPKYNFIANPIRDRVLKIEGVRDCVVDFTWEPAWTITRLSAAGRREMGLDDSVV